MVTSAVPPWHGDDGIARDFLSVNCELLSRVSAGNFKLSQFNDVQDKIRLLRELMWRHYVVFWSARYAARATAAPVKMLIECGVCDGLTVHFAMNAVKDYEFKAYLYDAWEGMKAENLLESEKRMAGSYGYLSVENTMRNLREFDGRIVAIKGVIPASFTAGPPPAHIAWLHIDLNSAVPTTATLEELFGSIQPGGVVLFDDYGGFADTRAAVNEFFQNKPGALLPMPTGQAMFFKH
jgi:hypothetical protein